MTMIRWMVKTGDRIGMIQEVAQVFSDEGVSIKSMEASTGKIFVKFHLDDDDNKIREYIKKELMNHKDIQDIINIGLQPHEQREKELERVLEFANKQKFQFKDIIYVSAAMEQVINIAQKVVANNCSILISGESGTGKEMFAQAIHHASTRQLKPFVPINCAAIPETLLESELFGYEEGAFTGARKGGKSGLFEAAHNGTLFFDEIGELPLALQGKLLRVLQEGVVRRVGGTQQIPVNVRILAATNRSLEKMVLEKTFRQDLYYRINVIPIQIPSLRQRPEDIPLLVKYFNVKYCAELNRQLEFSPAIINHLMQYEWPGNVRELQNVVLRAIHLTNGQEIDISNLLINQKSDIVVGTSDVKETNLKEVIDHTERVILEKALKKYGSARGVARDIGLSHTAVLTKIRRYGLEHLLHSNLTGRSNIIALEDRPPH